MTHSKKDSSFALFCDLDGVLVDFDRGVKELTGRLPSEQNPRHMWPRLANTPDFYARLQWMPDGKELWNYLKSYRPIILTGLPLGKWAKPQKVEWCRRELGERVPVLAGWSKNKATDARRYLESQGLTDSLTPLLIDDREKIREPWIEMGGVFILHRDTETTISELQKLGL